jgi:hypothetical protein
MLALLASLVSLACVAVAAHRLSLAVSSTPFDLGMILGALNAPGGVEKLRQGLAGIDCWERDLLEATGSPHAAVRAALIEEQVLEAGWAIDRWARAPRVCASVATSAGFLCASLSLIQALGSNAAEASVDATGGPTLTLALDALALGVVGTAFSVAVHVRARALTRQRRAAVDKLVDHLRALPAPAFPGHS